MIENNNLCECGSPIICVKVNKLNKVNCCWDVLNWIVQILLLLAIPASIVSMSFGFWVDIPDKKINNGPLTITTIFSSFFSLIVCMSFVFVHIIRFELIKKYENIIGLCSLIVINFILFIYHVIGYLVSKYYYDIDTFFNYVTCGYGYIISLFVLVAGIVFCSISFCVCKLSNNIQTQNSKEVVKYGVVVNELYYK